MSFGEDFMLKILVQVLGQLVTPESIKEAEGYLIAAAEALAKNTASKVDDALVKILADALGVPVTA